jgi:hypothetical protein
MKFWDAAFGGWVRLNTCVIDRHFDHSNARLVFMSRPNRPDRLIRAQSGGVKTWGVRPPNVHYLVLGSLEKTEKIVR